MTARTPTELRTLFARRISTLYGIEVPVYRDLVEVSRQINQEQLDREGPRAERLGSIARTTAERHGAVRVGTPVELAQLSRIFLALGMQPVGFYDLRDAQPRAIPVVATAFRPIDHDELAINPFRMFTSMLVPEDRRFFDADLSARLNNFLRERRLFPDRLLVLAERAIANGHLESIEAEEFLDLAVASFALSNDPIDYVWYAELERISSVAADIGGVTTTHVNHLTPRVLDIDELYRRMDRAGVKMISSIQGPPAWSGPDVLLRQTSFKAMAEPRSFVDSDGSLREGTLQVRFGEVEARGIALTAAGRDLHDRLAKAADEASGSGEDRAALLVDLWEGNMPKTEIDLWRADLAFFRYVIPREIPHGLLQTSTLPQLVDSGWIQLDPIVYEDFLPRSAAGIFTSNLVGDSDHETSTTTGTHRDMAWLSDVLGSRIHRPEDLYRAEAEASSAAVERLTSR